MRNHFVNVQQKCQSKSDGKVENCQTYSAVQKHTTKVKADDSFGELKGADGTLVHTNSKLTMLLHVLKMVFLNAVCLNRD